MTETERFMLLASYVPFFIIPFIMTVDMTMRISSLMNAGERALSANKAR